MAWDSLAGGKSSQCSHWKRKFPRGSPVCLLIHKTRALLFLPQLTMIILWYILSLIQLFVFSVLYFIAIKNSAWWVCKHCWWGPCYSRSGLFAYDMGLLWFCLVDNLENLWATRNAIISVIYLIKSYYCQNYWWCSCCYDGNLPLTLYWGSWILSIYDPDPFYLGENLPPFVICFTFFVSLLSSNSLFEPMQGKSGGF